MIVSRGALLLVLATAACAPPATNVASPAAHAGGRRLNPAIAGWLPKNRQRLDVLLSSRGKDDPRYDPAHPPVATFDWDNTMMRNDIGDTTMAWMLLHDAILQPPKRDWAVTSEDLTPEAWLVQPMFIEPLAPRKEPYPCSTALDAAGVPIVDEAGKRMVDQIVRP